MLKHYVVTYGTNIRKIPIVLAVYRQSYRSIKIERLRYPGSGLRVASFSFRFLLMSAFLPVISTRFPTVNHDLHVNVKRVNLEKKYGEACKYFDDFITHKMSDKKPITRYLFLLRIMSIICRLLGIKSCDFVWFENLHLQLSFAVFIRACTEPNI